MRPLPTNKMPIHLRENQYPGVNAHLHSTLQSPGGGWESFHAAHITNLTEAIDALLPEGNYVLNEKSLQLSTFNIETEEKGISPTRSVVIYRAESAKAEIPVTRIELLSPGNKPGGAHYPQYIAKRNETLDSGINLVEIDYLHESRSTAWGLPGYPDQEPGSYPYTILVSTPRPSLAEGRTEVYGFYVGDSIPRVRIPLAGEDVITVDFGEVYNITFSRNRYYGTRLVDYEQLPVRFETYTPDDQQRIQERIGKIAAGLG